MNPDTDAHRDASREGPLGGRRVVVTRPEEGSGTLASRLTDLGAEVFEVPLVATVDPADGGTALNRAAVAWTQGHFDWLLLTSPTGARRFLAALPAEADPPSAGTRPGRSRIACIGPGTAAVMTAAGLHVDLVPDRHVAEGMLEVFPSSPPQGGSVLFPRAAVGRDLIPEGLGAAGWSVELVEAYRTVPLDLDHANRAAIAGADAVVLTSSSAAQRLADALGADLGTGLPATVVCIGPVTAGTATTAGIGGVHVADVHSLDGLIDAVVSVLAR